MLDGGGEEIAGGTGDGGGEEVKMGGGGLEVGGGVATEVGGGEDAGGSVEALGWESAPGDGGGEKRDGVDGEAPEEVGGIAEDEGGEAAIVPNLSALLSLNKNQTFS